MALLAAARKCFKWASGQKDTEKAIKQKAMSSFLPPEGKGERERERERDRDRERQRKRDRDRDLELNT